MSKRFSIVLCWCVTKLKIIIRIRHFIQRIMNNNNNQQPTTNDQQPTTNNQRPTTNNQQKRK